MRLQRSKNALKNIVWGLLNRIITLILPFFLRTILIYTLGSEYLGLNSLFTSVLTVLNLAELGFSNAIVFSMYKPIAENDTNKICALIAYYKKVYSVIGTVIFIAGLLIMPLLPYLINGSYPNEINLYNLYFLFLINTSISYFLFAYKISILSAYQQEYVLSKVDILIKFIIYIIQTIVLLIYKNYYMYIITNIIYTIVYNIICAQISTKKYPQYKCSGILKKDDKKILKKNISGLMIGKICMVSRNSFDNIFISAFLGLHIVAIYGNYYYIMNAVVSILGIFMTSISAGIGNSIASDTVEKNYKDMNRITFIYEWITGWFTVCLFCLYQPFMKIWMGKEMLFPMLDVTLICIYFYTLSMGDVRSKYSNAAGLFWESRNYVLSEAAFNICFNYIFGKFFGVHGIIFATLITIVLINFGWGSHIVFKHYFKSYNIKEFYIKNLVYFSVTVIATFITYFSVIMIPDNNITTLFIKAGMCTVIPNFVFLSIYKKTAIFHDSKEMLLTLFKSK